MFSVHASPSSQQLFSEQRNEVIQSPFTQVIIEHGSSEGTHWGVRLQTNSAHHSALHGLLSSQSATVLQHSEFAMSPVWLQIPSAHASIEQSLLSSQFFGVLLHPVAGAQLSSV